MTIPPLDDIRVRRAINYAIDRQGLIDNVYGGNGQPANDIFLPTVTGYHPDVKWEYDPAKAKRLLAEAAAAGTPIDQSIRVTGEVAFRGSNGTEIGDNISAMLQAVGLNTHATSVEDNGGPLNAPVEPGQQPSIVQNAHGNASGDAYVSLAGKLSCSGPQSRVCDPAFEAMLTDASAAGDEEREAKLQAAAKYTYDNHVALMPVVHLADTIVVVNENIRYEPNSATGEKLVLSDLAIE